jgi:hypothetical protein
MEGTTYYFKVQARNLEGYGSFSDEISALAAEVSSKPDAPVTVWSSDFVSVVWTEPDTNGAAITSYTIYIRTSDLVTYQIESTSCDGSVQAIIDNRYCTIHVSLLTSAPFNLPWGSVI